MKNLYNNILIIYQKEIENYLDNYLDFYFKNINNRVFLDDIYKPQFSDNSIYLIESQNMSIFIPLNVLNFPDLVLNILKSGKVEILKDRYNYHKSDNILYAHRKSIIDKINE